MGALKEADIVHLNAGLHDIVRTEDATVNRVPLGQYRQNVETILKTITDGSDARVVWATTTPVNEEWHSYQRVESDVVAYNEAAVGIAAKLGVEIDDLFRLVSEAGRDRLLTRDGRHFTEDGDRLLGKAVADVVRG